MSAVITSANSQIARLWSDKSDSWFHTVLPLYRTCGKRAAASVQRHCCVCATMNACVAFRQSCGRRHSRGSSWCWHSACLALKLSATQPWLRYSNLLLQDPVVLAQVVCQYFGSTPKGTLMVPLQLTAGLAHKSFRGSRLARGYQYQRAAVQDNVMTRIHGSSATMHPVTPGTLACSLEHGIMHASAKSVCSTGLM